MDLFAPFKSRKKVNYTDRVAGIPEVKILNLDLEEEHNKLAVTLLLKRYYKVMKWLFRKYTK